MYVNKERPAKSQNEPQELMTFQFSESKQEIRNLLIENKPWFVSKDICDVLEIQNSRQAVRELDDDEKLMYKLYTSGQNRKMWLVSESGLYALVLRSNKPQAKVFRKWITSEVIPALLKKGYYAMHHNKKNDFIDARNIPYSRVLINHEPVRNILIENVLYYSINDYHAAMNSRTGAYQAVKKLNKIEALAKKIWLFGNTHPAWFTSFKGLELLSSGSRITKMSNQLNLPL